MSFFNVLFSAGELIDFCRPIVAALVWSSGVDCSTTNLTPTCESAWVAFLWSHSLCMPMSVGRSCFTLRFCTLYFIAKDWRKTSVSVFLGAQSDSKLLSPNKETRQFRYRGATAAAGSNRYQTLHNKHENKERLLTLKVLNPNNIAVTAQTADVSENTSSLPVCKIRSDSATYGITDAAFFLSPSV